jgi:hypothetical protein
MLPPPALLVAHFECVILTHKGMAVAVLAILGVYSHFP